MKTFREILSEAAKIKEEFIPYKDRPSKKTVNKFAKEIDAINKAVFDGDKDKARKLYGKLASKIGNIDPYDIYDVLDYRPGEYGKSEVFDKKTKKTVVK